MITDQPIVIDNDSPSLFRRVVAYTCDVALIFCLHVVILIAYTYFVSEYFPALSAVSKKNLIFLPVTIHYGLFVVNFCAYFIFSQVALEGQTVGQKLNHLGVRCKETQSQISLEQITIRTVAYLGYYFSMGLAQLYCLWREESLADNWSRSQTVCTRLSTLPTNSVPKETKAA